MKFDAVTGALKVIYGVSKITLYKMTYQTPVDYRRKYTDTGLRIYLGQWMWCELSQSWNLVNF